MMIDRLRNALAYLEYLSPEAQEKIAAYIEELMETHKPAIQSTEQLNQDRTTSWQDPFGAWSNLPDTMLDDLDQLRHANPPTLPLDL